MLKKVYGIMERFACDGIWPDYEEFSIYDGVTLILETDDGERLAYLYQLDPWMMDDRRNRMFKIDIPKEFPLRWFVNTYLLTREYGGPEEGGWYWDCYSPENSFECIDENHANDVLKEYEKGMKEYNEDAEPYCNVNSTGELSVVIEHHPPIDPQVPHYE